MRICTVWSSGSASMRISTGSVGGHCCAPAVGVGHAGRVLEGGEQCGEHGLLFDHVMFKTVDQSP